MWGGDLEAFETAMVTRVRPFATTTERRLGRTTLLATRRIETPLPREETAEGGGALTLRRTREENSDTAGGTPTYSKRLRGRRQGTR